jgi:hypothetical protein
MHLLNLVDPAKKAFATIKADGNPEKKSADTSQWKRSA